MSFPEALILLTVMLALALLPSTSVALVVTRSATLGLANGAAVALGIVLGDLIFVGLALLGMTALAERMGTLFLGIKYAAGIYLIWFGINLLRDRSRICPDRDSRITTGMAGSFVAGLLVTLGDVKAIFFYASLFPAFVDMRMLTTADIASILMITIVSVGGVKLGYAWGATRVSGLRTGLAVQHHARRATSGLMVGSGVYLIVKT